MSHSFTITQSFKYESATAEYIAHIKLLFHCGPDGYLPEVFREQYAIFDSALSPLWGLPSEEGRWKFKELTNDDLETLKQVSTEHARCLRATINNIVLNNKSKAKKLEDLFIEETFHV